MHSLLVNFFKIFALCVMCMLAVNACSSLELDWL